MSPEEHKAQWQVGIQVTGSYGTKILSQLLPGLPWEGYHPTVQAETHPDVSLAAALHITIWSNGIAAKGCRSPDDHT